MMVAMDTQETSPNWAFAGLWESIAAHLPDEPAAIWQDRTLSWGEFDRQANALAHALIQAGLGHQSKVGLYCQNRPEYLVGLYACFKAGLVPFNVNYRYGPTEVGYLLNDGDAEAVLFETAFAGVVSEVRHSNPGVRLWVEIGGSAHDPASFEAVVSGEGAKARGPVNPGGDDILILYTGGTTGMPKGVMWRQEDLIGRGGYVANAALGLDPLSSPAMAGPRAARVPIRPRSYIACPLMHGTGLIAALSALNFGGCIILPPTGKFDPATIWSEIERHKATRLTIVGEPFAQPLLAALDAEPGRWDLSSLRFLGSSGAMWSAENKQGLLKHLPEASLADSFSSSEAVGMGSSITVAGGVKETASFSLGADCAVFDEDNRRVEPGSGVRGRVAIGGHIPLGYYKDPDKTASAFPIIEGKRWSMPGDWAEVNADGTLHLLGRGSQCINTGGEKVFPEEVEEALKRHPAVRDAAVAGAPDPRFGERVCAVVDATQAVSEADLIAHVKSQLAAYKAPRHILFVDEVPRGPNGKMDYRTVKSWVLDALQEMAS